MLSDELAARRAPSAAPQRRFRMSHGTMLALALSALVLGIGVWRIYARLNPPTYRLTMSTGSFSGANYTLAKQYLEPAAREQRVALDFVETGGSEDTLNAVQEGRIQVAMLDGGLGTEGRENVREIAPLFTTGLHVLVKQSLYDAALASGDIRTAIRGKRVSMSNVGSGTRIMSLALLKALGLSPNEVIDEPRTVSFLVDPKTTADQVPDVVMAASLLPSPIANRLMDDFGYRLLPLDFVEAYRLQDPNVYGLEIPAGTYSLSPLRPPTKVTTIGRRILLVANKDVPDEAVTRLAQAVFDTDFARVYDPPLTIKQFDLISEFPRHPGAQAYLESRSPVTQDAVASIVLYLTGISAIVVCLPLFVFLRGLMRKVRFGKRLVSVNDFLAWVSEIEAEAHAIEDGAPGGDLGAVLQLRRRLSRLKLEAMDRYRQGLIEDPEHMGNLVAHVSDARIHLNALIAAAEHAPGSRPVERSEVDGRTPADAERVPAGA